jgi:NAD(P)-dependent dehydrogenase (short-subunit alcohol dehydrogenase family)
VAANHFRERQGSEYGGALINIGSVLSDRAIPRQGHYCATKHAIKGFTDALRMELQKDDIPVSVTLIKPSAINTAYPEHAANYMDEEPVLPQPSYDPDVVAPRLTDKIMEAAFFGQQQGEPAEGDRRGTLHEPKAGTASRTGSGGPVFKHSLWTQMQTRPLVTLGAAAAALVWSLGRND